MIFFSLIVMKWFPLTVEAFTGHALRQTCPYHTAAQPQTHTICHTQALCATHAPAQPLRKQGSTLTQTHKLKPTVAAHADAAKTGPFGLTRPAATC